MSEKRVEARDGGYLSVEPQIKEHAIPAVVLELGWEDGATAVYFEPDEADEVIEAIQDGLEAARNAPTPDKQERPATCACWYREGERKGWTSDDPCPIHPDERNPRDKLRKKPAPADPGEQERCSFCGNTRDFDGLEPDDPARNCPDPFHSPPVPADPGEQERKRGSMKRVDELPDYWRSEAEDAERAAQRGEAGDLTFKDEVQGQRVEAQCLRMVAAQLDEALGDG